MKSPESKTTEASRRVFSRNDAVAAYEHFARRAVDIFNTEAGLEPQLFFVALDNSEPRNIAFVKALDPEAVASFEDSDEGRVRRFRFIAESLGTGTATFEALKRQGMPVFLILSCRSRKSRSIRAVLATCQNLTTTS